MEEYEHFESSKNKQSILRQCGDQKVEVGGVADEMELGYLTQIAGSDGDMIQT